MYDLEPGDILLMNGLTVHRPMISSEISYIRSVIHFSPNFIQGLLKSLDSEFLLNPFRDLSHTFLRTKENQLSKKLEDVFRDIAEVKENKNGEENTTEIKLKMLLTLALTIINDLTKMKNIDFTQEKSYSNQHVIHIIHFIQENYRKQLSLDIISESLNLSKSHMTRLFRDITGLTIMEYAMEYRLQQAKYFLRIHPDHPIKQIAFKTGFESPAHFSRYFREKVGQTPRQYREDHFILLE